MPLTPVPPLTHSEQQRRRLAWFLIAGNLLLGAVLAGMVVSVLVSSRAAHEEQARGAAEGLVAIASASLASELGMIDTALRISVHDLQQARFAAQVPDTVLNENLAAKHRVLGGVEGFRLSDENGFVRWGNGIDIEHPFDLTGRDFFQLAKSAASDKAVVSAPVVSRVSGNWVVIVARPLWWEGAFKGVLYATIHVDHFRQIFRRYDLAANDAIALRSADDLQLVAWLSPGSTASGTVGDREVSQTLKDSLKRSPSAGSYFASSRVDAQQRTVAYRQVDGWPFITVAGFDNETFFAQWRSEMTTVSLMAGLVWALSCAATFAVFRFGRRELQAIGALQAQSRRTQTLMRVAGDGIHIIDQAGKLVELSDSFAEMHGSSREQLQGRHVSSWDVNQDEARINAWLSKVRDGDRQRVEVQHLRADGSVIDVDLHWRAVDIDGKLLVFGSARDITDRKRLIQSIEESAAHIRDLYDHAPCGYFSLDAEGRFVHLNAVAGQWLGAQLARPGRRFSEVLDAEGSALFNDHFLALAAQDHAPEIVVCLLAEEGPCRYIRINSTAVRDADGNFRMSRTVAVDITAQRDAQMQIEALLRDQSAMLNSDIVGMVKLRDRKVSWKNSAFEKMLGYAEGELDGVAIDALCAEEDGHKALAHDSLLLMGQGENFREDVRLKTKTGGAIWVDLNGVQLSDEESFWMAVDISEAKLAHAQITHVAFHDALTQLPNRLLLLDRMKQALAGAERFKHQVAVCFIDLDGFKAVNDQHGHDAGDKLLVEIAARIKGSIRATDTAARLGGDEFVVLLAPVAQEEWRVILERLMQTAGAPVRIDDDNGVEVTVGITIGVALSHGRTQAEVLIAEADEAMLHAKRSGKQRIHLAGPGA